MKDAYFEEPHASQLEEARHKARETHRLTYDCFHAKVSGDRVYCAKGYSLYGRRGETMGLVSVLRGWASSQCKSCPDFDGEPKEII